MHKVRQFQQKSEENVYFKVVHKWGLYAHDENTLRIKIFSGKLYKIPQKYLQ